jgi:hypothetical protein
MDCKIAKNRIVVQRGRRCENQKPAVVTEGRSSVAALTTAERHSLTTAFLYSSLQPSEVDPKALSNKVGCGTSSSPSSCSA